MLYQIDATLEDGKPRLRILDAQGDCLRLAWQPAQTRNSGSSEIQRFFRELLLMTAMDELLENSHHRLKT